METDTLSDVLRAVRLTGAIFFRVDLCDPWVAEAPPTSECGPFIMPHAQHVMEYHVMYSGSGWGGVAGDTPVRLEAGDVIAFPKGDAHVLCSIPGLRQKPDHAFYRTLAARPGPFTMTLGTPGPPGASIICGFLGCDVRPFNPLIEALPRMLHVRASSGRDGSWLRHLIDAATEECVHPRMGGGAILARQSELMFVELVRRHVEAMPRESVGWFAGLRDPHVGRALNLLHARSSSPWTLDMLARQVGMSRSSLAERFTRLIGRPPMQYLGHWRIQVAAGMLREGTQPVARIASTVGYESEAAFSRAFHKLTGMPPVAWRRAAGTRLAPVGTAGAARSLD